MGLNDVREGTIGAFEQLEVTNGAAVALTSGTYKDGPAVPTKAVFYVEDASVRIRGDGTAPTTSVGLVHAAGSNFEIEGPASIAALQLIAVNTAAKVNVHYIR